MTALFYCKFLIESEESMMRKVYLDDLPKHGTKVDWENSIGYKITFTYDDVTGCMYIKDTYRRNNARFIEVYYNGDIYTTTSCSLRDNNIGNIVGRRKLGEFRYNIGQALIDEKRSMIITDRKYIKKDNHIIKMYKYTCNRCGWDNGWADESFLYNSNGGCSCCVGRTVVEGINDIPTTAPWMIDYFQNGYDEAKQYTKYSTKIIFPICPFCKKVSKNKHKIFNIYQGKGFGCDCKDGISYPEKYIMELFKQINVEYIYQACHTIFNWSQNKKYDFYLPKYNCIVEVHGEQHYRDTYWTSLKYESNNDIYKKELALSNGITNYFEIDCKKSESDYIINSIVKSNILNLLEVDYAQIDFTKCDKYATRNIVKDVCDYYSNVDNVPINIAKHFGLYKSTIHKYLNQGNKFGWCIPDYTGSKKPISVFKDDKYIDTYESASFLGKNGKDIFGTTLDSSCITAVCKGKRKSHKGYVFKYAR